MTLLTWIAAYFALAFCTLWAFQGVGSGLSNKRVFWLSLFWPLTLATGIIDKIIR